MRLIQKLWQNWEGSGMSKIDEAIEILRALGLPKAQQNKRSGLTLVALVDLRPSMSWSESRVRNIRIHDMMAFFDTEYNKQYAENSRETIRRQTIHQFEQAGIVARNTDDPLRPTNSPNTVYALTAEALFVITKYGTSGWTQAIQSFAEQKGRLIDKYEKRRKLHLIPIELPDGTELSLSPGKHNALQVRIVREFRSVFSQESDVIYLGDTARKMLHRRKDILSRLKIPITKHDKLPDVVLFDAEKNHLLLIEAVTAHGPLSPKRQTELEEILSECPAKRIYVSAFLDFKEFKKHIDNIAWETEVWIAENPGHMIHFNGPKFFTAYD